MTPTAHRAWTVWCGRSSPDFYLRGRGFSTEDLIRLVNRISRRRTTLLQRVSLRHRRAALETIFGYAGYRSSAPHRRFPFWGEPGYLGPGYGFSSPASMPGRPFSAGGFHRERRRPTLEGQPAGAVFRLLNEKAGSEGLVQDPARRRGTGTGHDRQGQRARELSDRRDPVADAGTVEATGRLAQTLAA